MSTTDPTTGFLFHEVADTLVTWAEYVNDVVDPINDWAKGRMGKNYVWANAAARTAQTGMITGETGYQTDTAIVYRYSGSAWKEWDSDWITWTTAPTNLTVGSGGSATSSQKYKWINGKPLFECKYILGTSGFSVGTNPTINLPITLVLPTTNLPVLVSEGSIYDASPAGTTYMKARMDTTTTVRMNSYTGAMAAITATAPITFAANDQLAIEFWGQVA